MISLMGFRRSDYGKNKNLKKIAIYFYSTMFKVGKNFEKMIFSYTFHLAISMAIYLQKIQ